MVETTTKVRITNQYSQLMDDVYRIEAERGEGAAIKHWHWTLCQMAAEQEQRAVRDGYKPYECRDCGCLTRPGEEKCDCCGCLVYRE